MTPRLVTRLPDGVLRTVMLGNGVRIGAAADCDLIVAGFDVSPVQARVRIADGVPWVEETGAPSGVWINGERLTGRRALSHLDVITLGSGANVILLTNDTVGSARAAGQTSRKDAANRPPATPPGAAGATPPTVVFNRPFAAPQSFEASAIVDTPPSPAIAKAASAQTSAAPTAPAGATPPTVVLNRPFVPPQSFEASAVLDTSAPPVVMPATRAMPALPLRPPVGLGESAIIEPDGQPADSPRESAAPPPVTPPEVPSRPGDAAGSRGTTGSGIAFRMSGPDGTFEAGRGTFVVGRDKAANVRIDSREASRRHAIITVGDEAVSIEDLGSANGTKLNGQRLVGRAPLRHGDRIEIAKYLFRVEFAPTEEA